MRASIVIAAHNEGALLRRTLESCFMTIGALGAEVIVADDASTDDSIDDVTSNFPDVILRRHATRRGASATKALGAKAANGSVLLFLDGHTKPEFSSLERLVQTVELTDGQAIITPTLVALDAQKWRNDTRASGHGYALDLLTLDTGWLELDALDRTTVAGRVLYRSPSLIGCAFAIPADLYHELRGFDEHMRSWGVEDVDLGLKSWLMGHEVLHDPQAVVGHRFRDHFDSYYVPAAHVVANQLRLARKNYTQSVWERWTELAALRNAGAYAEEPEGVWAAAWLLFNETRASAEQERAWLQGRRKYDEFWYAKTFRLSWPELAELPAQTLRAAAAAPPHPSPSPPPTCRVTGVSPGTATVRVGTVQSFTAAGNSLGAVHWQAVGGSPSTGIGPSFSTKWATAGSHKVTASCGSSSAAATVTVVAVPTIELLDKNGAVLTAPQIGLWDHAFDPATGNLRNDAADAKNFVSLDSRRFVIRVRDAAAHGRITVSWRTGFDDGSIDDSPTSPSITLLETPANSGTFLSRPLLLVTDSDDKDQPVNSGLPAGDPDAGLRNPNQSNHRLRRVTVSDAHPLVSQVLVRYVPSLGAALSMTSPVFRRTPQDDRRRTTVHLVNLRDAAGGTPILTIARKAQVIAAIQAAYARCGIFATVDEHVLDPPTACTGWATTFPGDLLASDPSVEGVAFTSGSLVPSASQNAVFTAVQAAVGIVPNDLYAVYVSRIYDTPLPGPGGHLSQQAGGEAFPDAFTPAGPARGFAFIAIASGVTRFADPHELTHNTTNLRTAADGHFNLSAPGAASPTPIEARNLMNRFFLPDGTGVANPKRLWDDAFTNNHFTPPVTIPAQLSAIRNSRFVAQY
jgi:GT2 family glycosyltransferase